MSPIFERFKVSNDNMTEFSDALSHVKSEFESDDVRERSEFLKYFASDRDLFAERMAYAKVACDKFDKDINGDEKKAYVVGLVGCAISLHIVSMKLLLSGYSIPAGNLQRQVLETIALACLCADKHLGILDKFIEDKYSANKSIGNVKKHASRLGINKNFIRVMEKAKKFYDDFSHPSLMTIASISSKNGICLGSSFDLNKLEAYKKDVAFRISLANVFVDFVEGVAWNVKKWQASS